MSTMTAPDFSVIHNQLCELCWFGRDGKITSAAARRLVKRLEEAGEAVGAGREMSDAINAATDVALWDHYLDIYADRDTATKMLDADKRELNIRDRDAMTALRRVWPA